MQLIEGLLDIIIVALLLRLLIRPSEAHFNPIYGLLYRITEPLLAPSRYVTRAPWQGILLTVVVVTIFRGILNTLAGFPDLQEAVGRSLLELVQLVFQGYMVLWFVAIFTSSFYTNPLGQIMGRAFLPIDYLLGILGIPRRKILPYSFPLLLVLFGLLATILRGIFLIGAFPSVKLLAVSIGEGLLLAVGLFPFPGFFSIVLILGAILSWFSPDPRNPLVQAVYGISEPLLSPFRKFVPSFGAIDVSPIVALLAFQILGGAIQRLIVELFRLLG